MSPKKSAALKLAFIGMSGIGKSFWGRRLAARAGFTSISCDDEIQKILVSRYPGSGVEAKSGVAAWMKSPWEEGHKQSELEYLELEEKVTSDAIDSAQESSEPFVIDTTGSVIYLAPKTIERLGSVCTTVLFEHSPKQVELLFETYLAHPKPLIWGSSYTQAEGESKASAMARSFRDLLSYRESQYRSLANVVIPMGKHKDPDFTVEDLLSIIQAR